MVDDTGATGPETTPPMGDGAGRPIRPALPNDLTDTGTPSGVGAVTRIGTGKPEVDAPGARGVTDIQADRPGQVDHRRGRVPVTFRPRVGGRLCPCPPPLGPFYGPYFFRRKPREKT